MDELSSSESSTSTLTEPDPILIPAQPPSIMGAVAGLWRRIAWRKIGWFILSIFLFLLAITLMKEGARALTPLVRDGFKVTNPANSLGFGWLFAYLVMGGSPVAAASLTFFDAGVISQLSAFTMIGGSRLGAGFIVLFIGFIYVLRGRNKATSLNMGLLSLVVTGTTYVFALVVGLALLQSGVLNSIQLQSGVVLNSLTDLIFDPLAAFFLAYLPRWSLFLVGLGIILVSFSLFDKCLPEMSIKESQVGHVSRLVYRPIIMFLLGAAVTMVSMSVSVSLSILVPLSHRGFVRRENVIPYIMGANITTFIDTLLAAVLLNNAQAVTIVLAGMLSIALVSMLILATIPHYYQRGILTFVAWIMADNKHLAFFIAAIFIIPILLLFV